MIRFNVPPYTGKEIENVKKAVEEYNQLTKEQKNQAIVELSESIIIKLDYYNLF